MADAALTEWDVRLDPVEVATNRTELVLNAATGGLRIDQSGIDWGDAAIQAYMADELYGSSPVDFRIPNRMVTIPLGLGMDDSGSYDAARESLHQKVALLQREGGWLKRARTGQKLYADIVNATLHEPDMSGATGGVEAGVTLTLECLPDFYGDEITLSPLTGTGQIEATLPGATTNLLTNPSFESAIGAEWSGVNVASARVTSPVVAGAEALRLTASATSYSWHQNVPVVPGTTYTLSVYLQPVTSRALGGSVIVWKNGGGGVIGTVTIPGSPMPAAGQWTRYSVTGTAPAGAASADVYAIDVGAAGAGGDVWYVDAVQLTADPQAVPYGDTITPAVILGDYPARARLIVSDTSGNQQKGLVWGVRSRHYDPAATAKLFYEAESMTGLNGAASAARTGASGGSTMKLTGIPWQPGGLWVAMMLTDLSGLQLTHQGSYRVLARVYTTDAGAQLRLLWGSGSLASPITNEAANVPSNFFFIVDLGTIRIDAPPVTGQASWQGVFQVNDPNGSGTFEIDDVVLQPIDESSGRASAVTIPSPAVLAAGNPQGAYADDASVGTRAWTLSNGKWYAPGSPGTVVNTHYLKLAALGLAIPGGATIKGIQVRVTRQAIGVSYVLDDNLQLLKAGVLAGSGKSLAIWPTSPGAQSYGFGTTDLWGTTWTPADINNAGFGVELQAAISAPTSIALGAGAWVTSITVTVYYTFGTGFTVAQDVVIDANGQCEIRTEGAYRPDPASGMWGEVSTQLGDLLRLPPSGIEQRPVELLLHHSRGDLGDDPVTSQDSFIDAFAAVVKYRPCWLHRP